MLDKKATDALILQVAPLTSVADYLVIGSADSDRQASAIVDYIDGILSRSGSRPLSIEGKRSSQWVLMDFGDVIVHIFRQDVREHYALEGCGPTRSASPSRENHGSHNRLSRPGP
jgi:ribosome-associated protein